MEKSLIKGKCAMKKLNKILTIVLFVCLGASGLLGNDLVASKPISALIHHVYNEKMQIFIKFNCKENRGHILSYYNKYFTQDTSVYLTNLVENGKAKFNGGAFAEDPRYSDAVRTNEPDDPWMHDQYRIVKKIVFLPPVINANKAVAQVDSLVQSNEGQIMRSEFHLIKIDNNWKIDNIIWGPKGEFEENSTQGLSSIK